MSATAAARRARYRRLLRACDGNRRQAVAVARMLRAVGA